MNKPENIVNANSVIGVKVTNNDKENLGKIEEIMIDKSSGEVQYVVLSFGGILGMGEKLFALPWRSISYSPEDSAFILDMNKEKLENAPAFEKSNWPDMSDPLWKKTINSYYGIVDEVKNEGKDKAKETMQDITNSTKKVLEQSSEEVKKSGKDWVDYLQNHPMQSILFAIVGYFALRGAVKK